MIGIVGNLLESPRLRPLRRVQLIVALGIYGYAYLAPVAVAGQITSAGGAGLHAAGSALLLLSLYVATRQSLRLSIQAALTCLISFGLEVGQSFSSVRVFDGADLAANALGVGIGVAIVSGCSRLGWLGPT